MSTDKKQTDQFEGSEQQLTKRLSNHLKSGEAFMPVDDLLKQIPLEYVGKNLEDIPYTIYELVYHMRLAQLDIIRYCSDSEYEEPEWPEDYWPERSTPFDEEEWNNLLQKFIAERDEFREYIIKKPSHLFKEVQPDTGHTLLRQILLLIEHNAYHIGQLYVMNRLLP